MYSSCARQSGSRRHRPQLRLRLRQPVLTQVQAVTAATPSSKTLCTAIACLSMPLTPHQIPRHVLSTYYFYFSSLYYFPAELGTNRLLRDSNPEIDLLCGPENNLFETEFVIGICYTISNDLITSKSRHYRRLLYVTKSTLK